MQVIKNDYYSQSSRLFTNNYAPFWGEKLSIMNWHKRDKFPKFYRHWDHRRGLQMLLMDHVMRFGLAPTDADRKAMVKEIQAYVAECYEYEHQEKLKDVYITDHKPVELKKATYNEEEDQDFFDY